MKFQAVAPKTLVAEGIESEYFLSLLDESAGIALNDVVKILIVSARIPALTHDGKWQSRDNRDCRNQEYRAAFDFVHDLPSVTKSGGELIGYGFRTRNIFMK